MNVLCLGARVIGPELLRKSSNIRFCAIFKQAPSPEKIEKGQGNRESLSEE